MQWTVDATALPEDAFDLLADLRRYGEWLPNSSAFHGTLDISPGEVAVGTTYVEPGPLGTRYGKVTELDRPTTLNFEQPMALKPRALGVVGIRLYHDIRRFGATTRRTRTLELRPTGLVRLGFPVVKRAFRRENERFVRLIKEVVEARATADRVRRGSESS